MARKELVTSSSSSESKSDSDASTSDGSEVGKIVVAGSSVTSIAKKIAKKLKKAEGSSSESSSSSSSEDDEDITSSSSSSSSSSGSEEERHELGVIEVKCVEALPAAEEIALEGKVSSVELVGEDAQGVEEPIGANEIVPSPTGAVPEKKMDAEAAGVGGGSSKPIAEPAIAPMPQENKENDTESEPIASGRSEPIRNVASDEPEPEKDENGLEPGEIPQPNEAEDKRSRPENDKNDVEKRSRPEKDQEEVEPESKKKKFEAKPSAIDPPKEFKTKEVTRRRSSKDRSRSPGRRDRRRSRDRNQHLRGQRSRSRSRDRRRRRSRSRSKDRPRDRSQDRRGRGRSPPKKDGESKEPANPNEKITERQRRTVDLLTSRTGGAYIPPAKLRMMQAEITDKASAAYQRIAWEALKKSIHGYINKVNVDNIGIITRELLKENIVRGRGLLCRSIIQAQAASPTFTHVYAALVAIINSKFPNIGELLLKRLVIQFKRAFRRNDKAICLSASRFVAHLVNQRVAHEILALEILTLLVETPTDDSVEVAIAFLKECGMKLTEVTSKGIGAIFEMLKNILHEGKLDKRVQYMIEVVFQVRKDGFKDHQSVIEALELVEEDDQFTHLLMLDEATTTEDNLNAFKFDDKYETNEDKYKGLSKEILGSDASNSDDDGSGSGSDDSDSEEEEDEKAKADAIIDSTETNLVALRRTIYLTINSSLDYEECAHKLMKMQLKPGQEIELCHMFLDCCAEQRTYEKFYGLLAQRFCSINKTYIEPFEEIFKDTYRTTHRLDTNRLRNVSKFFAHLLFTDAIGWDVIECIKLNEDDTTSSSRIFIKILFQELAEYMGLGKLNEKLKDVVLTESLAGLFPKDNPRNTRFAINFFTSIGLGGLTDDLRQFLKNAPKNVPAINAELLTEKIDVSSTSSSSSSSPSSSSSSDSSTESSSSEDEKRKKKKKKKIVKKKVLDKSKKNKKKTKPVAKKKKSKKHDTSSSESATSESSSSSSSSSSESSSSTSDSSSEDDKKKKRNKKKVQINKKKSRKEKPKETANEKEPRRGKEKDRKRNETEGRISNGRSENGRGRDEKKRNQEEKAPRDRSDRKDDRVERNDRKDSRKERSPNRERHYRDKYNQPSKSNRDYRSTGKSRNGSKERG